MKLSSSNTFGLNAGWTRTVASCLVQWFSYPDLVQMVPLLCTAPQSPREEPWKVPLLVSLSVFWFLPSPCTPSHSNSHKGRASVSGDHIQDTRQYCSLKNQTKKQQNPVLTRSIIMHINHRQEWRSHLNFLGLFTLHKVMHHVVQPHFNKETEDKWISINRKSGTRTQVYQVWTWYIFLNHTGILCKMNSITPPSNTKHLIRSPSTQWGDPYGWHLNVAKGYGTHFFFQFTVGKTRRQTLKLASPIYRCTLNSCMKHMV